MVDYVTPVNQYLKTIDPQPYDRYLPNAFNDSLTMLEKVNKVIHILNEMNVLSNEIIGKWNDLVKQINTGGLIENKISEFLTDDTIITLIDKELISDFKQDILNSTEQQLSNVNNQLSDITINVRFFGAKGDGVTDDSKAIQTALNSLTKGGTVLFERGKTYIADALRPKSNTTIDLNGSTIIQKPHVPIYHNVFDIGGGDEIKNVVIKHGKLDGNKANQTAEFYRYGIYTLNCDNVLIEDIEAFDFTGDGIFIGYTGYYSKNIFMKRVNLHGSLSNDLAITNAENVYIEDLTVDSIAHDSASVDLELQDPTDKIINVHFKNLFVHSTVQRMKIVKNGYPGVLRDISIDTAIFTGGQSLGVEDTDFISLNNIKADQGIEIYGCRDVTVNGMKIRDSKMNGLYLYPNSLNGNKCTNVILNNIDVMGSKSYGVLLQEVNGATLNNVNSFNNKGNGIGILYNNKDINLINVNSSDKRTTNEKTQPYGIEFQGVNTNVQIIGGNTDGNVTGNYLNLPPNINVISKNMYRFTSPSGNSHALKYMDDATLIWDTYLRARRFELSAKYNPDTDIIPNGSIFEDTILGILKYKTLEGSIQPVSERYVSAIPTTGNWKTGDRVYSRTPTPGSYIGWICVRGGSHNPNPWESNTSYSVGNLRHTGVNIYKCTVAGVTGNTPPTHTTGTATDGTVTWEFVDTLMQWKGFGLIQS